MRMMTARMTATAVMMLVMMLACGAALACAACGNPAHVPGERVVYDGARPWDGEQVAALDLSGLGAVRAGVFKTADTLSSLGVGLSYPVLALGAERHLYLDGAPFYDGTAEAWGAFVGLSTEAAGLPLIGALLDLFEHALSAGCSNVGYGYSTRSGQGMAYASWLF